MTIIYCFVNGGWGDDVVGVAVCATCGAVVGQHMSSNEDWAQHDLTRSYHVQDYEQHAKEQHRADAVQVVWLEKPEDSSELRALLDKQPDANPDASCKPKQKLASQRRTIQD